MHKPAGKLLISPARCKGVRDLKPATVIACSVMQAHARALAFMPYCILTRRRAFLLLAIGLDDINLAVHMQASLDKVVEPSLGQLPIPLRRDPGRSITPPVLQPLPVCFPVGQTNTQQLSLSCSPQDDRNIFLAPDKTQRLSVHVRPPPMSMQIH